MDRKLIQEAIDLLKDERSKFNMAHWLDLFYDDDDINWCKTAGCIAGLFAIIKKVNIMQDPNGLQCLRPGLQAAELAELDFKWAVKVLFAPSSKNEDGYYLREWRLDQITKDHAIDALENLLSFNDDEYTSMGTEHIWVKYCDDYAPEER